MARIEKPGKYPARAKEWLLKETKDGDPMLAVNWKVKLNPSDTDYTAFVTSYIVFHGTSQSVFDRSQLSVEFMGWKGSPEVFMEKIGEPDSGLDAHEVELDVEMEEYNGQWYPKVKWINRMSGLRREGVMSDADKSKVAATMAERLRAASERNKAKAKDRERQSGSRATKTQVSDNEFEGTPSLPSNTDDIPF